MIFHKISGALALLAFIFVAASLAFSQPALKDILSSGVVKVRTTGDWNPITMKNLLTNPTRHTT